MHTIGRFAPSPSGRMHLGNVLCALLAWLSARQQNGEFLLRIDTTVAFCDEEIDIFVAQNLLPGEQHLDPDEVIDVQTYELSELLARIERGEIRDAKTVAGLTAYALKQSRSNRT